METSLRPVRPEDIAFLFDLYCSTRAEEVSEWGWDESQQVAFLRMQFDAQRSTYAARCPGSDHRIIEIRGEPAGRLLVDRRDREILLVDISLLPEHRNRGVGTHLIKELQAEANRIGKPVRLHVLGSNQANRLYERLGFKRVGSDRLYHEMVWVPDT